MDIEGALVGAAITAGLGIGALAFRNIKRWPIVREFVRGCLVVVWLVSFGFGAGAFFSTIAPDRSAQGSWTAFVAFFAATALLVLLELAHWLRKPEAEDRDGS